MKIKLLFLMGMVWSFSIAQIPKPSFNYSYSVGNNSEIILKFKSNSQGDNLEYDWSFPGANLENSDLSNPQIVYNSVGEYIVTLKVKNDKGESSLSKKIIISGDTNSQIIDLSTGVNDNGTTMSVNGVPDSDWTVVNPNGVAGTPITRQKYTGWSDPWFDNRTLYNGKTTWIRSGDLYSGNGDYYYKSKTFIVPENVTNATLNLRALAFVRQWTYLVKINEDETETDVAEISRTLWLNDGAKGWLNSRSSGVEDYNLSPGKYYIRARVYTNNGNLRDAVSVNGYVSIGNSIKVESLDLPVLSINESRICVNETKTISAAGLNNLDDTFNYNWKIYSPQKTYTSDSKSPSFQFIDQGSYTVKLSVKKGNLENDYLFKNQLVVEPCEASIDKNVLAAPNSYIYDINLAKSNNYGGIYIPVKKAYDAWQDKDGFINQSIPSLNQSASVVWQDKENLISSVSIVGSGIDAKLKVEVNPTKGKGNAVVALHIGNKENDSDPIYWSWHIWVTDDPTNGVTYVNNADSRMVNTFMDRNLGALSNSFLGHDWNKSGGLLYQWGRKDPFPPMRYIDETLLKYYTKKNGEINNTNFAIKLVKDRPFDLITDNIKYVLTNPSYFIKTERGGAWFASIDHNKKVKGQDGDAIENYDLWGDNNKGVTKKQSFEKQIKSPYDPCPAGWRVPSFAHSESTIPNFSPWGSGNKYTIGDDPNMQVITESSNRYPNAKFYLRMGVDFKGGTDNYDIGKYSLTGGYKRSAAGNVLYQDNYSESNVWSATLRANVQGRNFHIINDPDQPGGRYLVQPFQEGPTSEGSAIRCVKDEITNLTFDTEYFNESKRNYTEGLNNPNSYILYTNRSISIPVSKAYAVYNQVLTDREWIPNGKQTTNVYWTTNKNLVKSVEIAGSGENANINVKLNDNQYGNAVVSLHVGNQGSSEDPVYWSWHLWVPKDNPEENTITYVSDESIFSNFKAYNTSFGFPPMKTEFMNRVLGALDTYNPDQGSTISGDTYGMLYQWGRKDPLPGFYNVSWEGQSPIYKGSKVNETVQYTQISDNTSYINSGYQKENLQNTLSINEMKLYGVQNPLNYLANLNDGAGDWISNIPNVEKDRWGHASKKSINDPCPEGWRVPDYGFNINLNSPWAKTSLFTKNNKGEFLVSSKLSDYKITKLSVRPAYPTIIKAFSYYNPSYTIGYLPATGNRRFIKNRGVSMYDFVYAASVWSASMIADYRGYTYGMDTFADVHLVSNVMSPSQGRNVVCSKDVPRFSKEYFEELSIVPVSQSRAYTTLKENIKDIEQVFYPNPVEKILKTNSTEKFKVEIYSISGNKVLEGQFNNQELNISQLKSGIYVLVLENGKTYKIIKK